jgi:hypothetical protein
MLTLVLSSANPARSFLRARRRLLERNQVSNRYPGFAKADVFLGWTASPPCPGHNALLCRHEGMLSTVRVPDKFAPLFEEAQKYVARYFAEQRSDPEIRQVIMNLITNAADRWPSARGGS